MDEDNFSLRIRRVTNGFIVDMHDSPMHVPRQAVFQTVAQIAEALPMLLKDPSPQTEPKSE